MDRSIDFDRVAPWYDAHVQADFDVAFWVEQARRHPGQRLELMCGTGRLSVPILEAGMGLTCVDRSAALLAILREKLARRGLSAEIVQQDVRDLDLSHFDYAFIGFHSFAELAAPDDARAALRSIHRVIRPSGRLVLSLHNPAVRAAELDGTPRKTGPFELPGGNRLEVTTQFQLDRATSAVTGWQRYAELHPAGRVVREEHLTVRFRLTEPAELDAFAAAAGFTVLERWGDYDWSPYLPDASPYYLCELGRS